MRILAFVALFAVSVSINDDHFFTFGNPQEKFHPCTLENKYFATNVIRSCFGPHIDGSSGYVLADNILSFHENHESIAISDVFIDPETQTLYEIVSQESAKKFRVVEINPLEVFTKIKLRSGTILEPQVFEGFFNLEISGLNFAVVEYETTRCNEIFFTYKTNETTPNQHEEIEVFKLSISILGFNLTLAMGFETDTEVTPIQSLMITDFAYTRNFHHETSVMGVFTSANANVTEVVSSRSYLKKYTIEHNPCHVLEGNETSFEVSVVSYLTFLVSIGSDSSSVTTTTHYVISNHFEPGKSLNNQLRFAMTATNARAQQEFSVKGTKLWDKIEPELRYIDIPMPLSRQDLVRNATLWHVNSFPVANDSYILFLYPSKIECSLATDLLLRFDLKSNGMLDSLLLEPLSFTNSTVELRQDRTMVLPKNIEGASLGVLVRDLKGGSSEYWNAPWEFEEGEHSICNENESLCVTVEIARAYGIETDRMYFVNESKKYMFFEPSEDTQGGYTVVRHEPTGFVAGSDEDVLHTGAVLSVSDPSIYWNLHTFVMSFSKIYMHSSTRSVGLALSINTGNGQMLNIYNATFVDTGPSLDQFDKVLFQMKSSWSLMFYITITNKTGARTLRLFKYSYGQIRERRGSETSYDVDDMAIDVKIDEMYQMPILARGNMTKFFVSQMYDSETTGTIPKSEFAVFRYEFPKLAPDTWPTIRGFMLSAESLLLDSMTFEGRTVVDLIPGVNVKSRHGSVIVNIPVYINYTDVSGIASLDIYSSTEDGFCDKYSVISSSGKFDIGCIEFALNASLKPWLPDGTSYLAADEPLSRWSNVSKLRIYGATSEGFNASLYTNAFCPSLATTVELSDTLNCFPRLRLQCSRCQSLLIGDELIFPDESTPDIFTIEARRLPVNISAVCKTPKDAYCINSITVTNTSVAIYEEPTGMESYTPEVHLESGVTRQVYDPIVMNYSKKWFGDINFTSIAASTTLILEITVRSDDSVWLRGYADDTSIPFSAMNMFADPASFLSQLGVSHGTFLFDGRVLTKTEYFLQPELGTYSISNYTAINLSQLFGFDHSDFTTFIIRCSKDSPQSPTGLCLAIPITASFSPTGSLTPENDTHLTAIIAGTVVGSVIIVAVVIAVVLVYRRRKQQDFPVSDVVRQNLLEECTFAI